MGRGSEVSQPAYDRHLCLIKRRYGKQVFINLLGDKEGEALLGRMYKAHHKTSRFAKDIPFIAFDYHRYVTRGRPENVKILKDQIIKYLFDMDFFSSESDNVFNQQLGTFRVNCVDCLDRTNRVQTLIGLEVILSQLARILEIYLFLFLDFE